MATLNEKIRELELELAKLKAKVIDLSTNTEEKYKTPQSVGGGSRPRVTLKPVDTSSGRGQMHGGQVIWNSNELDKARNDTVENPEETNPIPVSYNKHSHSRYSGGALDINTLEIVEYDYEASEIDNPHSPAFWKSIPVIKKSTNGTEKIGNLHLEFNEKTKKWTTTLAIDVESCQLIKYRSTANKDGNGDVIPGEDIGDVEKDENGNEMKSSLYNEDPALSSLVWDSTAKVWRIYAVYAQ